MYWCATWAQLQRCDQKEAKQNKEKTPEIQNDIWAVYIDLQGYWGRHILEYKNFGYRIGK